MPRSIRELDSKEIKQQSELYSILIEKQALPRGEYPNPLDRTFTALKISSGLSLPSLHVTLRITGIIHRLLSVIEKGDVTPKEVQIQMHQFVNDSEPEIDQPKNLNTFVISPCYNQINKLITVNQIQAAFSNRLIFAKKN